MRTVVPHPRGAARSNQPPISYGPLRMLRQADASARGCASPTPSSATSTTESSPRAIRSRTAPWVAARRGATTLVDGLLDDAVRRDLDCGRQLEAGGWACRVRSRSPVPLPSWTNRVPPARGRPAPAVGALRRCAAPRGRSPHPRPQPRELAPAVVAGAGAGSAPCRPGGSEPPSDGPSPSCRSRRSRRRSCSRASTSRSSRPARSESRAVVWTTRPDAAAMSSSSARSRVHVAERPAAEERGRPSGRTPCSGTRRLVAGRARRAGAREDRPRRGSPPGEAETVDELVVQRLQRARLVPASASRRPVVGEHLARVGPAAVGQPGARALQRVAQWCEADRRDHPAAAHGSHAGAAPRGAARRCPPTITAYSAAMAADRAR